MTAHKFILLLPLFIVSCNHNKRTGNGISVPNNSTESSHTRTIKNIDTTYYIPIKNGFYKTSVGDLYELKKTTNEDSLGWYDLYFLDSTIVYGDYSNRKPPKDLFDLPSYSEDSVSNFSKDKNHVYYTRAHSDRHIRFLVKEADSKTFVGLKDRWGRDNRHIFYENDIVKNADLKTFELYKNSNDTAADKNHVYYRGEINK